MYSLLYDTVTTLTKNLSWLQGLSMKQQFCWCIVNSCCEKIRVTKEHFVWAYLYNSAIICLGSIYNTFCKWKGKPKHLLSAEGYPQDIEHSPSDNIKRYEPTVVYYKLPPFY